MSNYNSSVSETIQVRPGEELNLYLLEKFINENIDGLSNGPLKVEQFSTGNSNLTYLVRVGEWEAVLRRAPKGPLNKKAHDMHREFKVLKAINPVFPLAPKPYIFHEDSSIAGAPFYLMERRHGVLLQQALPSPQDGDKWLFSKVSEAIVETLVELHEINYKETNLVNMTCPEGFLERQVNGWLERYENVKLEEDSRVSVLIKWLIENLPTSQSPTVIHYDFHLNNVMFDRNELSKLSGVFDWEMSTVGDPLTDLATALVFWCENSDTKEQKDSATLPITLRPGFMTRNEMIEKYAKKSGRDVSKMSYYMAFSFFKNMVIAQQIYYRWKMGFTKDERFAKMDKSVRIHLESALQYI